MGDFRKQLSWRPISREKIYCKEIPGEKYPAMKKEISLMTYNVGKILHRYLSQGFCKKNSLGKK